MAVVKWQLSSRRGKQATKVVAVAATGSLVALGCTAAAVGTTATPRSAAVAELVASAPVIVGLQSRAAADPASDSAASDDHTDRASFVRQEGPGRSSARTPAPHKKTPASAPTTVSGLPVPALRAYKHAESVLGSTQASCGLAWYVLAGIGMAESDHGRVGDSVIAANGRSVPRIVGPVLNGQGPVAAIRDSDRGRLDGDKVWDRAVGPMQFIPQTWATMAADGDGNDVEDPNDLDDAALAAASYLCRSGGNLADDGALAAALRTYNNSDEYVLVVMAYADAYRRGAYPTVPAGLLDQLHGPDKPLTPKPDKDRDKPKVPHKPKKPRGNHQSNGPGGAPHQGGPRPGAGGHEGGSPRPTPEPPKPPKPPKPEPPAQPKPPKPEPPAQPKPPKPVTKTVVLTGVPSQCGGDWCVGGTDAGQLAVWPTVADYDGDCKAERMTSELQGLVDSGTTVQVTVAQTTLAGEVTDTVTKGFQVIDGPTCDEKREATVPDGEG